jgi:hypothetical protein
MILHAGLPLGRGIVSTRQGCAAVPEEPGEIVKIVHTSLKIAGIKRNAVLPVFKPDPDRMDSCLFRKSG